MISIIDASNRGAHFEALETMFEDRKRLFVDLLGWDVPVIQDRFEIDQFDGKDAVYIASLDDTDHQGSLRLLPTLRPHILSTLFQHLCAGGAPADAQTWEITRLCLPTRLGATTRLEVRNALITAMVDFALASNITRLTGVVEERFRKEVLTMGWLCEPLGPATRVGDAVLGAFALHLSADTPARLGWTGIYRKDAEQCAASVAA